MWRVTRRGGRGGWSAGLARAVAPLLSPRSLRRRSAQPGLFVVVYTCARASFCGLAVCGIVHLVAVVRNAAPRCLVCAGRALSRARRELAARWALPSWVGCMRSVACVCVRSALAGARIFGGVDRAVPRAAAPGGGGGCVALAFALVACSLCSLGRVSWCGRSWIIIGAVCARPHPPPAIASCFRWGGVGLVVSREPRVPALSALCGDMHARRYEVPWWPLGHQGT